MSSNDECSNNVINLVLLDATHKRDGQFNQVDVTNQYCRDNNHGEDDGGGGKRKPKEFNFHQRPDAMCPPDSSGIAGHTSDPLVMPAHFVASSEKQRVREILHSLRAASVLTVGDTLGFARMGGMINFVLEENRVRFEINVRASERAHLKLSARLLTVAKLIVTDEETPGN